MFFGESRLARVHIVPVAIALAVGINLLLTYMIFRMVTPGHMEPPSRETIRMVDFVRLRPAIRTVEPRQRERPVERPPPKQEEPPKMPEMKQAAPEKPQPPEMNVEAPQLTLPFKIAGGPSVGAMAPAVPRAAIGEPVPAPPAPSLDVEEGLVPTYRAPPTYPPRALRAGIEGVVTVEFTIGTDGSVTEPKIIKSDPPEIFDEAVMRAIMKWKFNPKVLDGTPAPRRARQDVRFTLNRR